MNDVLKVLQERRSCRNFQTKMIPKKMLDVILEAGTYAPSGMGKQSDHLQIHSQYHEDNLS